MCSVPGLDELVSDALAKRQDELRRIVARIVDERLATLVDDVVAMELASRNGQVMAPVPPAPTAVDRGAPLHLRRAVPGGRCEREKQGAAGTVSESREWPEDRRLLVRSSTRKSFGFAVTGTRPNGVRTSLG